MQNNTIFESDLPNSFHRVSKSHPLDLYSGIDESGRRTLFLISDTEPPEMQSSQIIKVTAGKRKDDRWGISFSLIDDKFEDIFAHFCNDIIESSITIKNKARGADYISSRYLKWQDMLAKFSGDLLQTSAIKGLIGELFFLKSYLIPLYGEDVALDSWIGPDKADQDFVCNELWYEVKSTVSGSDSVKIASIEQLDVLKKGELVIINLDDTSRSDAERITLNSIFREVHDYLSNEELKRKLSGILLSLGYFERPEYDQPGYKHSKTQRYSVNEQFPCLRRCNLPNAVINTNYELSISSISDKLIRG